MVLWIISYEDASGPEFEGKGVFVEYDARMPMGLFLRDVIAPRVGLECKDGTVLAKVHTPELRVVFNNAVSAQPLGSLVRDYSALVVSPWPKDGITVRSLLGNARC
jgi:hypothetical protein